MSRYLSIMVHTNIIYVFDLVFFNMNSSVFISRKKYAESVDTILHMSINRNNEISLPVDRVIFDESLHRAFFCFFYIQSEILSYQIENIGVGIGQITHEINRI